MRRRKALTSLAMAGVMTLALLSACGSSSGSVSGGASASTPDGSSTPAEPEKITWWYYHKGDEGAVLEKAIEKYNASQSRYVVEGFSVPDKQKYLVAMAGNESPDVIEVTNQDIVGYQANGLLEDLSKIGAEKNFDFSIYGKSAVSANSIDDVQYGLPFSTVVIQMFYNKDILAAIGETEPPKTMEALYDMAIRATTLDADGNIDILGYPLFPLASARQEGIYAFGGTWVDADRTTPTPTSQGVLDSLRMNLQYREKYGLDKVQKFVATGNTNRYTPQDIFFAGKQLFRFDGPWLAKQIKDNNPDVNFGVALIPGTEANPELLGSSRYENTSLVMPVAAAKKEGAWDFMSWFVTEGAKDVLLGIGSLPANINLYDDADLLNSNEVFPSFVEALKRDNGIQHPAMKDAAQYVSLIEEHLDYVYNGSKTPEDAMNALQAQTKNLK